MDTFVIVTALVSACGAFYDRLVRQAATTPVGLGQDYAALGSLRAGLAATNRWVLTAGRWEMPTSRCNEAFAAFVGELDVCPPAEPAPTEHGRMASTAHVTARPNPDTAIVAATKTAARTIGLGLQLARATG
jgi:hypothetical protein